MAKPVVVIAPGSFCRGVEYDGVVENLNASGYESYAYDLPTASKKPGEQASTLAEDAMFFRGVLTALCDQAQNVVIVGHSYGGMVITEAVKGLTAKRVGKGRVVGMVYLTATAVKEGQSLGEVTAAADIKLDFVKLDGDFMYMDPLERSAETNFSDLPPDKGLEYAKRFTYHSGPSFGNTLQYAGYKDVENVAYIFCTGDKTLPPGFQEAQIDNINAARSSPTKVYKLETGHCPNVSAPVEVASMINKAITEFS